MIEMTYQQAIELLRKAVKPSHIKNQNHIDLSLVNAYDREIFQEALMLVKSAVAKGDKTQVQLNDELGL